MFKKLSLLYKILQLAQHPQKTQYVFDISNIQVSMAEQKDLQNQVNKVYEKYPNFKELYEKKAEIKTFDLEKLIQLPQNTFGYIYAKHMKDNNLNPDFFDKFAHDDEWNFYRFRMRQTHDIWHTLTGFTTHYIGEAGLQGFYLGQITNFLSPTIIISFFLHPIINKKLSDIDPLMQAITKGYRLGKETKPILHFMWEEKWEKDISELRKELNIIPVTNNI